jgi:thymidylate synthase
MNRIDTDYQNLLKDILENGVAKETRNGSTISVFGRQIRHSMKTGFPLLTTKKMAWKSIVTELLWFLRGDTNIKFLVDNDCHIWDGDAYKKYENHILKQREFQKKRVQELRKQGKRLKVAKIELLSKEEFTERIKTDDKFAKKWGELGPIYGKQWRKWGEWSTIEEPKRVLKPGIDQISELIKQLKDTPDSRRMVVNAWAVHDLPKMVLPPCHYGFQVYTRELSIEERVAIFNEKKEKGEIIVPEFKSVGDSNAWTSRLLDNVIPERAISLMWNQRSVDTFLGLPFNIASYGLLLEIIAKAVNMVPDELIGNLGDTHLYSNHIEQAKEQIGREPFELPKLKHLRNDDKYKLLGEFPSLWNELKISDFELENYQSHPPIKAPLSN